MNKELKTDRWPFYKGLDMQAVAMLKPNEVKILMERRAKECAAKKVCVSCLDPTPNVSCDKCINAYAQTMTALVEAGAVKAILIPVSDSVLQQVRANDN